MRDSRPTSVLTYVRSGLAASGTVRDLRKFALRAVDLYPHRPSFRSVNRRIRVAAVVRDFLPDTKGGAEWSLLATLHHLQLAGFEVKVVRIGQEHSYCYDGMDVLTVAESRRIGALRNCDVVISQKSASTWAQMRAGIYRKPFVLMVRDIGDWLRLPRTPDLTVFNANFQRDLFEYSGRSLVLYPPVDLDQVRTLPGSRITLVNLTARKGGELIFRLARDLSRYEFLGVEGLWGDQIQIADVPRNLRIVSPVGDVREVYSQTRILLLPSAWESFGRVALEAAVSGIPVVASRNAGTLEALGEAAIYVDRLDYNGWISAIEMLDDAAEYAKWSERARLTASRFSPHAQLHSFERVIRELATGSL